MPGCSGAAWLSLPAQRGGGTLNLLETQEEKQEPLRAGGDGTVHGAKPPFPLVHAQGTPDQQQAWAWGRGNP